MPFNSEQLAYAGKAALDYYLKNPAIDQVNISHPLLKKVTEGKKDWTGGLQYVVEQIRYQNDSNFQAYFGDGQVSYNRKRTINQAKYTWGSFHDGFGLNEDELAQNGVTMTDDRGATPTDNERIQLTNLLEENLATLKLGFDEGFDMMIHRDGTQDPQQIPGLNALVSLTPSVGTVGTIDASLAANAFWRNYAATGLATTPATLLDAMEAAWRACIKFGGSPPDFLLAGATFIDAYRNTATASITRQVVVGQGNKRGTTIDSSTGEGISTGLYFKGIEILWDPVFDLLDAADAPTPLWAKRFYMLNSKNLSLRPIAGHWKISRRPPRVYDRYVNYWGLTAKAALTTNKRNAHAVLALT